MMANNYKISQPLQILPPIKQKVYPIPIIEWNFIKNKIKCIQDNSNTAHTLGSIFIGSSITLLITALINDFNDPNYEIICWSAFFCTLICGSLAFWFSRKSNQILSTSKSEVLAQMTIIEERYSDIIETTINEEVAVVDKVEVRVEEKKEVNKDENIITPKTPKTNIDISDLYYTKWLIDNKNLDNVDEVIEFIKRNDTWEDLANDFTKLPNTKNDVDKILKYWSDSKNIKSNWNQLRIALELKLFIDKIE